MNAGIASAQRYRIIFVIPCIAVHVISEAATLHWLRENTTIPVPRVFAFNDNPINEVGAAYIIEERVRYCRPGQMNLSKVTF
jgi:hypothetical protein